MMKNMKKQIPNILSVIRLLCIPVFVLLFNQEHRAASAGVFSKILETSIDFLLSQPLEGKTIWLGQV